MGKVLEMTVTTVTLFSCISFFRTEGTPKGALCPKKRQIPNPKVEQAASTPSLRCQSEMAARNNCRHY